MIRARIQRWAAALAMASLLAIPAMAGPVAAAVPSATASSEAIPAEYSAGNVPGFRAFYHYTDASTLAKLFVEIDTTNAAGVAYLSVTREGIPVAGNPCTNTLPITCTFKTVRADDPVTDPEDFVVLLALTPADGATSVSATFTWSTTGDTTSDGGTSHGDTWDGIANTSTLSTDPDYAGGFVTGSGGAIANIQAVSATNPQATRLGSLPAAVAASVKDGADVTSPCTDTAQIDCSDVIGEWSEVFVGDGQSFASVFTISIVYYEGAPKGFVHTYGDPGDPEQEFIGPCPKKSPASGAPCFTWSAKTSTATIYTFHNGSYRGLN